VSIERFFTHRCVHLNTFDAISSEATTTCTENILLYNLNKFIENFNQKLCTTMMPNKKKKQFESPPYYHYSYHISTWQIQYIRFNSSRENTVLCSGARWCTYDSHNSLNISDKSIFMYVSFLRRSHKNLHSI